MKKFKRIGKKTLSVILTLLMVMSVMQVGFFGASAAVSVGATKTFTLSPNGNRGNDSTETSWHRLALTGESSADGTSIAIVNFDSAAVASAAAADEIVLEFYSYSCRDRLITKSGADISAEVYYATKNEDFINAQPNEYNKSVADSGNTILGTNYSDTGIQTSAKNYFGLSESTKIAAYPQPTIDGQSNSSLRQGTANYSYDVTDIVKERAAAGQGLSIVMMLNKSFNCSGTLGWSDIYYYSDSFALAEYTGEDLTALQNAINTYETAVTDGKFYYNVRAAYTAYSNAKRYYDAVKYGGFRGNSAETYANALNTAVNTMKSNYNTSFIDWCSNANVISQDGTAVNSSYTKNLIWYPWDFSWNLTTESALWTVQDTIFYWTMPNIIVGVTDDSDTTFPLHSFFWTATGSRYVRYMIAGSGTISSGVVGSSDFSTAASWKISNLDNTHVTSGLDPGTNTDGFGNWVFERNYSGTLDNFEDNNSNFSYSQSRVYQVSSYAKVNRGTIGVNASNIYKKIDTGFTYATADSANGGTTSFKNGFASTSGVNGYVYAVYMGKYNKYYQTPSTLMSKLSYKNYNGLAYTNADTVAAELDYASNYNLNHNLSTSQRSSNIDSTVYQWATNINGAASNLEAANNNATTTITNRYVDLTNAITASESVYVAGGDKYTYASWSAFTNAYKAAREHMASLSPSGSNRHYSTDATEIGTLANNLNAARNALAPKIYDLGYENLFSFSSWVSSASSGNSNEVNVSYNKTDGSITVTSITTNAETIHSTNAGIRDEYNYAIPVIAGKEYTIEYTTSGDVTTLVSMNFYDASGNVIGYGGHKDIQTASGTYSNTETAPAGAVLMEVSFGTENSNKTATFSDIIVYEPERAECVSALNKVYRKEVEPGVIIGALNEPVRAGYRFDGWYSDKNYSNKVTEETVAEENMILYSKWTKLYTIEWVNYNGELIKKDESVPEGELPVYDGETPTREANAEYTYTFSGWSPEIVPATQNATYTATYTSELKHYTVTWLNEDGTVLETDTDVPYGTTPSYDGEEPTKAGNAQFTYTFSGWSPAIVDVTGDATYTAVFDENVNSYTVTWKDGDGNIIGTDDVPYGTVPVYSGEVPTKTGDAQYSYSWNNGWDKNVVAVTGDVTYTATFDEITNGYTVTWLNEDGTVLETDTNVLYGTMPTYDGDEPTKAGTVQFSYTFSGWSPEVASVTGDATYTAVFGESTNSYTITWKDGNGNTIETDVVPYGTMPTYDGEEPTKAKTLQYTYTWNGGWDKEVASVTGDETYTATFSETLNSYKLTFNKNDGTHFEIVCEYGTSKEDILASEDYEGNSASRYDETNHYSYKWDEYWDSFTAATKGNQTFNEIEVAEEHILTPGYGNSYVQSNDGTQHIGTCDAGCGYTVTQTHTGGTATCTNSPICSVCGLPYGSTLPHEYEDNWTSDQNGNHYRQCVVCDRMSTRETVPCEYPDSWTDDGNGKHSKTCEANGCGYVIEEDHDYSGTVEVISKASCYADGSKKIYCADCSAYTTETITKRTHSMGSWQQVSAPSYTAAGEEIRYCQHNVADDEYEACGFSETQDIDMLVDSTAPTGTIGYGEKLWDKFLNTITFNNYINYDVNVKITSADAESGIKSVQYYVSDKALSLSEVEALTSWADYADELVIAKADTEKKVVYAKLTNNQNAVTYLSTDGFTFDTTAPAISLSGKQNTETGAYCPDVTVTVTEENIAEVLLNSVAITLVDGKYTVSADGSYTVSVTDEAGNTASETFTIGHTAAAAKEENRIEATCTEKGSYDSVVYCSVCDEELSREEKEINIDSDAHKYGNWVAEVPANCVDTGELGHYECALCHKYFDENKAVLENLTIATNGNHDLAYVDGQLPTCEDFGWDDYEYCKRTGCGYTTYNEKSAIEHNWDYDNGVLNRPTKVDEEWTTGTYVVKCINDASHELTLIVERADYSALDTAVETIESKRLIPNLTTTAINEINSALSSIDSYIRKDYVKDYSQNGVTITFGEEETLANWVNTVNNGIVEFDGYVADETFIKADFTEALNEYDEYLALKETYGDTIKASTVNQAESIYAQYESIPDKNDFAKNPNQPVIDEMAQILATINDEIVDGTRRNPELKALTDALNAYAENLNEITPTKLITDEYDAIYADCLLLSDKVENDTICAKDQPQIDTLTAKLSAINTRVENCIAGIHEDAYDSTVNPTCDDPGYSVYFCDVCANRSEKDPVNALGHNYEGTTATIETDNNAQHYYICKNCLTEKLYENHNYGGWTETKAPTYDLPGEKERECSVCNYVDKEVVPALSDSVAPVVTVTAEKGNSETNVYCTTVTVSITEANAYTVTLNGNAQGVTDNSFTVSEEGVYEVVVQDAAGNKAEVSFTIGHIGGAAVEENRNESTCKVAGSYESVVYCTVCNEEISRETLPLPLADHTEKTIEGKASTCDDTGLTAGTECSVCGDILVAQTVIPELGHDYVGEITVEPTCTEDGEKTYTCKNDASHTYTEVIGSTGHKDENPADGKCDNCSEILVACEHANKETRNEKNATCVEEGYTGDIYCKDCGVLLETGTSIPKAHLIEYIDARESTCNTNGWKAHYVCKTCGKTFSDRAATTEIIVTLPTTEHNFGKWNRVTAPDCRSEDYEIRYCQNPGCGASDRKVIEGTRGAHSMVVVEGKEATCLSPGKTAYKYCVSCNYVEESEIIPQLPHSDKNADTICDMCSSKLYGSEACTCICHNDFFLAKFVYTILNFFWKLFGINKSCNCGHNHW